ncbi:TPR-like protein [Trichodelitschia bisporula]|uniref:TPR-like protein n=1 Tax=Trichodelitschia bisporula TaxID=703511 RepID=A0A6G1I9J1_9PEZI|nr:TPR-like protein [Trichodelitschia bisporula]
MASHPHTSPSGAMPGHHGPPPAGHQQQNGHIPVGQQQPKTIGQLLAQVNEGTWMQLGQLCELQGDLDGANYAYEQVIRHNSWSVPAMQAISCILRSRDQFAPAIDYLRAILKIEPNNGETWGSLGHCYLMLDNLQEAYSAYQQALYHLQDPKEPKLWYGIGILYDRYGSLEHAEEAFSQVMRMAPDFEKANEVYFRLGIIYKQQQKYRESLECFKYIVGDPPRPLTEEDIWFQIGHVHEQQKDFDAAKTAYKRVLDRDPKHAKVLQQLGWLYHQQSSNFQSQEQAIEYLEKSVASDQTDAQSWYLLGRCYMSQQKYPKAYEAYQQAVYRDGRNPTFWCSIGVLYYQINQYRDALDAYSRAIRLNPNISEVWYDLGTLYESCNNQTTDALDAYQRAADLDPTNVHIKARLQLLQSGQATTGMPNQNSAPLPQDIHPQAYQPAAVNGPPGPQWGAAPQAAQPPQGPPPPAFDYDRRLAEIRQTQPVSAPQHQYHPSYDQRDGGRPPAPPPLPAVQRPATPRQDMRPYQEPPRPNPAGRRGLTPSPKSQNAVPTYQSTQQALPLPPPPPIQPVHNQPPPPSSVPQPNRITNPNYGPQASNVPAPPITATQGPMGYNRGTPPPDVKVRPLNLEARPPSAGSNYQHQQYQHHASATAPPSIANGAPAPASALVAAESAARERDERAPKRMREWEDESGMNGKPAQNDEKRLRLDEGHAVRPPPSLAAHAPPNATPPRPRSVDTEGTGRRPQEDPQRRGGPPEYHPSEAAHHPSLPAIQPPLPAVQGPPPPPPSIPRLNDTIKEERGAPPPPPPPPPSAGPDNIANRPSAQREPSRETVHEAAARKMEVDEDYDDEEDEKRTGPNVQGPPPPPPQLAHGGKERESPRGGETDRS